MNGAFWAECRECFDRVKHDPAVKSVIITAAGKNFSGGLDMSDPGTGVGTEEDFGRRAYLMHDNILIIQAAFNSIEDCCKPVIACAHGACYGGAIDMITACDIRYSTKDTRFCIKEVDVGLAADVGTLQRLPKIVGNDSKVRELAYTARVFLSDEAKEMGLIGDVFADQAAMNAAALETACLIASKSPLAVSGTKRNLNYSRDHSVAEGLEYVATWNAAMLQSRDMLDAMKASMSKDKNSKGPVYKPLAPFVPLKTPAKL
jgi:enoyl-CoA hydratase/carnithine racemase